MRLRILLFSIFCDHVIKTAAELSRERYLVIRAQCEANCLHLLGSRTSPHDMLGPFKCTKKKCRQCMQMCTKPDMTCPRGRKCSATCQVCKDKRRLLEDANNGVPLERHTATDCVMQTPKVSCMGMGVEDARIYMRLRIKCNTSEVIPVVFVPTLKSRNSKGYETRWFSPYTETSKYFVADHVAFNSNIIFNVTAVARDGVVGTPSLSDWINVPEFKELHSPKNITVSHQVHGLKVDTVVKWEPPPEKGCWYKLYWMHPKEGGDPMHNDFRIPLPGFTYGIPNLDVGRKYTLVIESMDMPNRTRFSKKSSFTFKTPSCFSVTNRNYSICGPDPPQNFTYVELSQSPPGGYTYIVNLTWIPPRFAKPSNPISQYNLYWQKIPRYTIDKPHSRYETLNTTQTWFVVHGLHAGSDYEFQLSASIDDRESSDVEVTIPIPSDALKQSADTNVRVGNSKEEKTTDNHVLSFVIIPITIVIVAMFTVGAIRIARSTKRTRFDTDLSNMNTSQFPFVDNVVYDTSTIEDFQFNDVTTAETMLIESSCYDDFEINYNWLSFGEHIGEGAFGVVVKAVLKHPKQLHVKHKPTTSQTTVAVKMLKEFATAEDQDNMIREIRLMKDIGRHPFIVSMLGCCTRSPNICIIMDYCPFGDLKTYLQAMRLKNKEKRAVVQSGYSKMCRGYEGECTSDNDKPPEEGYLLASQQMNKKTSESELVKHYESPDEDTGSISQLLSYARQIAVGMEYLTQKKFVHRDLAARNILVSEENFVKISDFGLTRDIYENGIYHKRTSGRLPVKWMSIEAIFRQEYSTKSDVWSFGVVLWEIVTLGGSPYPGISSREFFQLLKDGYRMVKPDNCSQEMYDIMLSCWHPDPEDRPDFTQLKERLDCMLEDSNAYLDLNMTCNQDYYDHDSCLRVDLRDSAAAISDVDMGDKLSTSSAESTVFLEKVSKQNTAEC